MPDTTAQVPDLSKMTSVLVYNLRTHGLLLEDALKAINKEYIVQEICENKGNQCRAARALGMHRNTLQRQLQHFKIDAPSLRGLAKRRTSIAPLAG